MEACGGARVAQEHEGEQAVRFGLVGHQVDQRSADAERLCRQVNAAAAPHEPQVQSRRPRIQRPSGRRNQPLGLKPGEWELDRADARTRTGDLLGAIQRWRAVVGGEGWWIARVYLWAI